MPATTQARVWAGVAGYGDYTRTRHADDPHARELSLAAPKLLTIARVMRAASLNAVEWAACEGIDRVIDLGVGYVPAHHEHPHTIADRLHPDPRTLYVDHDNDVAKQVSRAVESPRTAVVTADVLQPHTLNPVFDGHLGTHAKRLYLATALLEFMPDTDAFRVLPPLVAAAPSGSVFVVIHSTPDYETACIATQWERVPGWVYKPRSAETVRSLLADSGLTPMDPPRPGPPRLPLTLAYGIKQ